MQKYANLNVTFPMKVRIEYDGSGRIIHPITSFGKYFDDFFHELCMNICYAGLSDTPEGETYADIALKYKHHFADEAARRHRLAERDKRIFEENRRRDAEQDANYKELYGVSYMEYCGLSYKQKEELRLKNNLAWDTMQGKWVKKKQD